MRRKGKIDENQPEIVEALRKAGCTVQSLASVGSGCTDLLVGRAGVNYLLEVKNPSKPKADQALTPDQVEWHRLWKGQVHIVYTVEDALRAVGAIKSAIPY